ncbi:MAG: molybdate ABC transporter substrate-binding protein, partial [Anderseniella sp.]|nr:molybdate ABC transporter substrate-binding protein [Anderseniella sp.]
TGHSVVLVAGATGKLATQILAGAPFDIFLAADQARPELLEEKNAAVAGSRFTYAIGSLVLWSPDKLPLTGTALGSLDTMRVLRLAIANPKLAPYGLAAEQALDRLGFLTPLSGRFVYGENIGQTFAMAASGNVTAGLIAKSQLASLPEKQRGHWIDVPGTLHEPILQDGVLIMRAKDDDVARSFMSFMKSDKVAGVIKRFGYGESRP